MSLLTWAHFPLSITLPLEPILRKIGWAGYIGQLVEVYGAIFLNLKRGDLHVINLKMQGCFVCFICYSIMFGYMPMYFLFFLFDKTRITQHCSIVYLCEIILTVLLQCIILGFLKMLPMLIEDEELVTNSLETIVNLAPLLDLRTFSSSKPSYIKITEKRAVQAIMGMLGSAIKAWHCAAAELLGRLIINPDNEPFLLPFLPQIHKRLVDIMSTSALEAQAAAVGALYNLAEVNMDCRLKLASERWAIDRLLKLIKTPHPIPEVCRKAAMILESLVSEPQNRVLLLAYENVFAEILFSESRQSDTFARILYELTSRPNNKVAAARGIWGM